MPSFFKKWNKDKLLTFYNHPGLKIKFYLQNHSKEQTLTSIALYDFEDPKVSTFFIVKEGKVQLDSRFDLEFICKVPLNEGRTQWNIH